MAISCFAGIAERAGAMARRMAWAAAFLGLGLALGCQQASLRGDAYPDNTLGDQFRQRRTTDQDCQSVGVSSKAQQIERDFGIQ